MLVLFGLKFTNYKFFLAKRIKLGLTLRILELLFSIIEIREDIIHLWNIIYAAIGF